MRILKLLAALAAITTLLALLVALGAWRFWFQPRVDSEYQDLEQAAHQAQENARDTLLSDQAALARHEWMKDRPCVKDAGEVLKSILAQADDETWSSIETLDTLRGTLKKQRAEDAHWMTDGARSEVQAIKLGWVEQLRDFDCWDLPRHYPKENKTSVLGMTVLDSHDSSWDSIHLLSLAARYLLRQLYAPLEDSVEPETVVVPAAPEAEDSHEARPSADEQHVHQVLSDVRRIATILLQSQELVASLTGAKQVLRLEVEAVAWLNEQGRLPKNWEPLDEETPRRLERILFAGSELHDLLTAPALQDLALSDNWSIGGCTNLREGLAFSLPYKGILESERFTQLEGFLSRGADRGCSLEDLSRAWKNPELTMLETPDFFCQFRGNENCEQSGSRLSDWPASVQTTMARFNLTLSYQNSTALQYPGGESKSAP